MKTVDILNSFYGYHYSDQSGNRNTPIENIYKESNKLTSVIRTELSLEGSELDILFFLSAFLIP
jgi:hypothetical protein